jgi:aryl-alcohol dehydrogenase-like predicted oxidoreductase
MSCKHVLDAIDATLALSWVLSNTAITAPIIGASRPDQLADCLAAADRGPLPADLKWTLDDLTHGRRRALADEARAIPHESVIMRDR